MRWWGAVDPVDLILREGARLTDEVEVYSSSGISVSLELKRREVARAGESHGAGLGIRVIREGRIGVSSTSSPERWRECLEAAVAGSRLATPQAWDGLPPPASLPGSSLGFDPKVIPDPEAARQLLAGMLEGSGSYPVDVTSGGASLSRSRVTLKNSQGLDYTEDSTGISISIETIAGQSTGSEFSESWRMDLDPRKTGEQAAFLASHCRDGTEIATGDYDCILSPLALAQLLGAVFIPACSGRNVHAGRSRLAGQLGKEVMDPRFSLCDDPFSEKGLGSTYWDAEGVPTRRIAIVKDGMLTSFLYDLKTAYRYGEETTGSAVRGGYGGAPSIGLHNIVLDGPRGAVMAEDAVYIHDVVGAHTANPMSGDFSVELSNPIRVEGGGFGEPVRKAMLSGNVFDLLRAITAIGDDDRVVGSMILPSVRVEGQHLVGA
jgi:PmbA protein